MISKRLVTPVSLRMNKIGIATYAICFFIYGLYDYFIKSKKVLEKVNV